MKENLEINVELPSPGDFIPELPDWQSRSALIATQGRLSFYHYDFYAQTLAKIERGHARDREDVRELIARDLVEPQRVLSLFLGKSNHSFTVTRPSTPAHFATR